MRIHDSGAGAAVSGRFAVLERGEGVLYGACESIWVMILHARPTAADMKRARPALRAMSKTHAPKFPTLTWVLPEAGYSMDEDARKAATEVTKEYVDAIVAQATLIEGTGFQAATVRAIISGLDFMSRSPAAKKVFSDLGESVAWCASRRPSARGAATVAEITAAVAEARASI
jgi:hypothetical protein